MNQSTIKGSGGGMGIVMSMKLEDRLVTVEKYYDVDDSRPLVWLQALFCQGLVEGASEP